MTTIAGVKKPVKSWMYWKAWSVVLAEQRFGHPGWR